MLHAVELFVKLVGIEGTSDTTKHYALPGVRPTHQSPAVEEMERTMHKIDDMTAVLREACMTMLDDSPAADLTVCS